MDQLRQLSAIMFTDIEGYTAMMQKDEEKAILIKDRYRLVLESEHKNFDGKIVQFYGDGTLSIFKSVVQAVRCAIKMQYLFGDAPNIPVRIGVHIGDIIVSNGDVFGDSVNIASRIESLGVPGCILISDKVNEELRNHLEFKTVSVGNYQFKNVQRKVQVFAIDDQKLVKPFPGSLKGKTDAKKHNSLYSSAPKKSIAVLPFVNLSNDPEQEYFSDGITEDILNSLSKLNDLKVAGRSSSFQFKGKGINLKEVGKKLKVKNVLEGSVQRQANKVRITVQLINLEDGYDIWSEKYDRDLNDIFAVQDEIAMAITGKLKISLLGSERERLMQNHTQDNEAYDLYLKGRFYWNRRGPGLKKGLAYFLEAVTKDPDFGLAHCGIADTYTLLALYSIIPSNEAVPKAKQAAEKAIALNPYGVEPYSILAFLSSIYDYNWSDAKRQFEKAFEIDGNYAPTHYWFSNYISWIEKDYELAIREAKKAIELEPLLSHCYNVLSSVYVCNGTFEEAREASLTAIEFDANSFLSYSSLGMSLSGLKLYNEAIEVLKTGVNISNRHQYSLLELSWLYSLVGNITGAGEIYEELLTRSSSEFISGLSLCVAAHSANKIKESVEFLELAFKQRAGMLPSINSYPVFSFIKNDPLYRPVFLKMNFPK